MYASVYFGKIFCSRVYKRNSRLAYADKQSVHLSLLITMVACPAHVELVRRSNKMNVRSLEG